MSVRRPREPRERQENHPTRVQIVEAAATILKTVGLGAFHVDDVLAATGLTRGAVYHHFDNVDDLVESALLATYAEGVGATMAIVQEVMATASTLTEFRDGVLRANLAYVQNSGLRTVRTLRAHTLAASASSERMAARLAKEQQRLTDAYSSMISTAQRRGWVRSSIVPEALSVFIQAYSFGVIIDDVAEQHLSEEAWAQIIVDFFDNSVFPGGG